MSKLSRIIEQLSESGFSIEMKFPKICLVGDGSCGKTSLLHSLFNLDFLPVSDEGITTRCTEIKFVNIQRNNPITPYAELDFEPRIKIENLEKQNDRILELFNKDNKIINKTPIRITIYSNNCPNITIIDTPQIPLLDCKIT